MALSTSDAVIDPALIADANEGVRVSHERDYDALGERLERRGIAIDPITRAVAAFTVAIPTWGVGTGGTRFARFPQPGEPRDIHQKLRDCSVIRQLGGFTPTVSPHFPWDAVDDYGASRQEAAALSLRFDAVNSNTFQDQLGQPLSYRFGSLAHTDRGVREQAIEHNVACLRAGAILGSPALTVWIGDGGNFPGQQHLRRSFERYLESMTAIYAALPDGMSLYIEHKLFEPAFYATVIQDWGSSLLAAQTLGERARCLVDLGHHAPTVNVELIVARLISARRLAGFHFNDSHYGDDDLDSGTIDPYRLFRIFNELVDAARDRVSGFAPAYTLDQSHNVTDPIESLIVSGGNVARAYAQALVVKRDSLDRYQADNDVLAATCELKAAFETDVTPIVERARMTLGGALDPVGVYRRAQYRARVGREREPVPAGSAGIV